MPIYDYKDGLPNYCIGPSPNPLQSDEVIRQTVAGRSFIWWYVPLTFHPYWHTFHPSMMITMTIRCWHVLLEISSTLMQTFH